MNKRTKHNFDGLNLSTTQIEELAKQWICNRRDRELVKLKFCDGLSYEEVAEMVRLSVTQTKTRAYRSVDLIREHCLVSL